MTPRRSIVTFIVAPFIGLPLRAMQLQRAGQALLGPDRVARHHPLEAPESEPYDRLLFVGDGPIKVQVKTVTHPRGGYFTFTLEQGYRRSPGGRHRYRHGAYDIAALVVLAENVIFFSADLRRVQRVATTEIAYLRRKPQASFLDAIAAYREHHPLGA